MPKNSFRVDDQSEFWGRFHPNLPAFDGKTVLEIGCGYGNRCLEAAAHGASRVVGVDPLEPSISIARANLLAAPAAERERVVFFLGTLHMLPPEKFDLIISESTLEHVLDVPELLAEITNRLNPGGQFYLGFGPLYHAFDGDHSWMRAVLPGRRFFPWPWGHLLLEEQIFRKLSTMHGRPVTNTRDWPYLSLNQHTFSEYQEMFRQSGLRTVFSRINYMKTLNALIFNALRHLPGLSCYFTNNIYMILENDDLKCN